MERGESADEGKLLELDSCKVVLKCQQIVKREHFIMVLLVVMVFFKTC